MAWMPDEERPRWAQQLSDEQWSRIGELLEDGYPAAEIARQVDLPAEKRRSLQLYVRQHGPRRRLTRFAEFKDALLANVEEFGGSFSRALTAIAQAAVDPNTKTTTQLRAIEAMTNFTAVLNKMMGDERTAEADRKREERSEDDRVDPNSIVRSVLAHYGVDVEHK